MTAKEHINQIQERFTSIDESVASTLANAIGDAINSIFGKAARIGYELLQNADDAGASSKDGVKFYLLERHLVIQHSGSHFTSENIETLCRYGAALYDQNINANQNDVNKIGYKGIGFKSVFNIADKVWLLSNDYTFRFDKAYWGARPMPWQIVPIHTELVDIPIEIPTSLDSTKVTFILELKQEFWERAQHRKLMNSIAEALGDEKILLFLRHVTNFEILFKPIESDEIISFKKIEKTKDNHVVSLQKYVSKTPAENSFSRWHVSTFQIGIPDNISQTLTNLDKKHCPEKLKSAKNIDLSFAAKLEDDNTVIPLTEALIFSYLPTGKKYHFPFIVNSNFLLNEARTELLPVQINAAWNEFLFKEIGYYQFKWFQEMAQDERFKFEFAGLLVKYAVTATGFNGKLNEGVMKAQSEIAFVPVLNSEELKKSPDTIIDKTGISYTIQEHSLVKEEFEKPYEIADPKIKNIDKLIKSGGANEFNHKKLSNAIKRGNRFKNPVDNTKLIDYFYNHINAIPNQIEKSEWMKVLYETPFLLDNDNNLQEPSVLYFPKDKPELPFELPMTFLNETIYSDRIREDKKLEDWLVQLKVRFPKPIEIIRNGLFPLIDKKEINNQNTIAITQYLFEHKDKLEKNDREKLSFLPLLTKGNSMYEAMFCYLVDECQPNLTVEQYIKDDIFVSLRYLVNSTDLDAWKAFWLSLNVRQDMDLELHEEWYDFNELKSNTTYTNYTEFLKPLLHYYEEVVSVIWLNEKVESKCPYDFEVIFENGIKHYWEVKTTPSATKVEFPISSSEIKFAFNNSESYYIIRIFNIEQQNPEHKILTNPIDLIKSGKIKINDVKMEIIE